MTATIERTVEMVKGREGEFLVREWLADHGVPTKDVSKGRLLDLVAAGPVLLTGYEGLSFRGRDIEVKGSLNAKGHAGRLPIEHVAAATFTPGKKACHGCDAPRPCSAGNPCGGMTGMLVKNVEAKAVAFEAAQAGDACPPCDRCGGTTVRKVSTRTGKPYYRCLDTRVSRVNGAWQDVEGHCNGFGKAPRFQATFSQCQAIKLYYLNHLLGTGWAQGIEVGREGWLHSSQADVVLFADRFTGDLGVLLLDDETRALAHALWDADREGLDRKGNIRPMANWHGDARTDPRALQDWSVTHYAASREFAAAGKWAWLRRGGELRRAKDANGKDRLVLADGHTVWAKRPTKEGTASMDLIDGTGDDGSGFCPVCDAPVVGAHAGDCPLARPTTERGPVPATPKPPCPCCGVERPGKHPSYCPARKGMPDAEIVRLAKEEGLL